MDGRKWLKTVNAVFIFMFSASLISCCVPKSISEEQAEKIGRRAIERFCETHRETAPADYKLIKTKPNVAIGDSNEKLAWEMSYISHQKNGSPYVEVIIMIDQCGGTETSFWDYTQRN